MEASNIKSIIQAIRDTDTKGDGATAYNLAKDAINQYPDSAELWAIIATQQLWRATIQDAHISLEKAQELGPDLALTWAAKAIIASTDGNLEQAIIAADKALTLDDHDSLVLKCCRTVYATANDYNKALIIACRWQELYPNDERAIITRMNCLIMLNHKEDADILFTEIKQRFPDSPLVWLKIARQLMMEEQRLDDAINLIKQAIEQIDGSWEFWGELSFMLSHANRFKEAETAAQRALAISPRAIRAMQSMYRICKQRGENQEAARWIEMAMNAKPALRCINPISEANIEMRNGEWEKAVIAADKALSLNLAIPIRCIALEIKGHALLHLKEHEKLEQTIKNLEELGWVNVAIFEFKAWLFTESGDHIAAADTYRAGILKYPTSGELRSGLLHSLHTLNLTEAEDMLIKDFFTNLPQTPSEYIPLITALSDIGYFEQSTQLRIIAEEKYPDDGQFRLIEAAENWTVPDLTDTFSFGNTI